jgi:hypothetical protein
MDAENRALWLGVRGCMVKSSWKWLEEWKILEIPGSDEAQKYKDHLKAQKDKAQWIKLIRMWLRSGGWIRLRRMRYEPCFMISLFVVV